MILRIELSISPNLFPKCLEKVLLGVTQPMELAKNASSMSMTPLLLISDF